MPAFLIFYLFCRCLLYLLDEGSRNEQQSDEEERDDACSQRERPDFDKKKSEHYPTEQGTAPVFDKGIIIELSVDEETKPNNSIEDETDSGCNCRRQQAMNDQPQ